MYIYAVGYHGWEASPYTVLTHDKLITRETLKKLIVFAFDEITKDCEFSPYYSSFYDSVIDLLISGYGFKRLEYTAHSTIDEFAVLKDGKFVTKEQL